MPTQFKSSKHTVKFANVGKLDDLRTFIVEYNSALKHFIDYFWNTRIEWSSNRILDVQNGEFDAPSMISTVGIEPPNTKLSARALKCASSQSLGIIKSVVLKLRKLEFKLRVAKALGRPTEKLERSLNEFILTRPSLPENIGINLNSVCVEFKETPDGEFDGFMILKSIGKAFGEIAIPIKNHKHSNRLKSTGYEQTTTWMILEDSVCSVWSREIPEKKQTGNKLGADQGIKTCITLSDGQITPPNKHGHTIETTMEILSRRKKGSKGYKRAQQHRTNVINYSINQLSLKDTMTVGFEDVKNLYNGKNIPTFMRKWVYAEIASKFEDLCIDEGVLLVKQGSAYRSQRCYSCGFVHKSNRKAKAFKCGHCGHMDDADLNGAKNHSLELSSIPFGISRLSQASKGFFWTTEGLFDLVGGEITVPHDNKS